MKSFRIRWLLCFIILFSCNLNNSKKSGSKDAIVHERQDPEAAHQQQAQNKITMHIDGEHWETKSLELSIDRPKAHYPFYHVSLSGDDAFGEVFNETMHAGISIFFRLDEKALRDPTGKYPVYHSASEYEGALVTIMPMHPDISYNNYMLSSPDLEKEIIGYLTVESAKLEQKGSEIWYAELAGTFELQLTGQNNDGESVKTSITKGTFHFTQEDVPLRWSVGDNDANMKVRLGDKNWLSDQDGVSIDLLDDGEHYAVIISASKSAMESDEENDAWSIRLFLIIPKDEIEHNRGEYLLGSAEVHQGEAYFEHGKYVEAGVQGKVTLDGTDFKVEGGQVKWTFISGAFELHPEGYAEPVRGLLKYSSF